MANEVKFVKDNATSLTISADAFLGLKCSGAGSMQVEFSDGAGGNETVTLTVKDVIGDGVEFKRAAQAMANSLGGHPRDMVANIVYTPEELVPHVLTLADSVEGDFVHRDITAVSAIES